MITVIQLLGGKGTRLEEITKKMIPKPLVEITGDSLLELQIKHLISFGCKDFIWICHYMSEAFEKERERLLEKYDNLIDSIEIYIEEIPLSTFGSLYNVVKHRNELEFLVLYGDVLINFDLYRFTKSFSSYEDSDNHVNQADVHIGTGSYGELVITYNNFSAKIIDPNDNTQLISNNYSNFQIRMWLDNSNYSATSTYSDDNYPIGTIQIIYGKSEFQNPLVGLSNKVSYNELTYTPIEYNTLTDFAWDRTKGLGVPELKVSLFLVLNLPLWVNPTKIEMFQVIEGFMFEK